jgi:hypothetical protein
VLDDHAFALCLTHDLDRPYKGSRSLYYAVRDWRPAHLLDLLPGRNPYWQFDEISTLEADLGVRSAFYVLNEPHILRKGLQALLSPADWVQHLGRYDVRDERLVSAVRTLRAEGWEIGLHGSYRSAGNPDRLRVEKRILEECLDDTVVGGRQHYLRMRIPETWRYHAQIGLRYDASLGSSTTAGFRYGYRPIRPFDDEFVVFPLTVMEAALPDPGAAFDDAWAVCEDLLEEAAANQAVMTTLWHPRYFSDRDFPGYRRLYVRLVERALDLGAWVGTPAECYRGLNLGRDCRVATADLGGTEGLTKP